MLKEEMVDEQVLKIAIQTVIHRRREQLETMLANEDECLLDDIASEITRRALRFQSIIESTVNDYRLKENL